MQLQQGTTAGKSNDAAEQHSESWESSGESKCVCVCVWYEVKQTTGKESWNETLQQTRNDTKCAQTHTHTLIL